MTDDMLDLIELHMMGGHKNTPATAAARAVLVGGLTMPEAAYQHGVGRSTLHRSVQRRLTILETAHQLVQLTNSHRH